MAVRQLTCAACGAQFVGHHARTYCSRKCWPSQIAGHYKPVQSYTYECAVCGKAYAPKAKNRDTTCSRECGWVWVKAKTSRLIVSVKVKRVPCDVCGKRFNQQARAHLRCSDECRRAHNRTAAMASYFARAQVSAKCRHCGEHFTPTERRRGAYAACSDGCRSALAQKSKRISRGARKAMERAARVERVDPIRVFTRDGWKCCDCGCRTPPSLRGSIDPRAPELDHIVPLAQGGEHSYRNTRCLCRACNAAKADGPGGQMLLFG